MTENHDVKPAVEHVSERPNVVEYDDKEKLGLHEVTVEGSEALKAAIEKEPPQRWHRRSLQLYACVSVAFLVSTIQGYDGSLMGNMLGAGYAAILFVNIFGVTYAFGITPLQSLYPVEVLSYEQRAKGMAFSGLILNAAIMVNQFGMPVAIQVLDWKLYFIFIAWCLFEAATVYFFMVETKERTLEELDEIFEAPNPRKASTQKKKLTLDDTANILSVEAVS
ncbi:Lactose permease [Penicillium rolfsii]|nr:Lactose permease [Penicillium rolfsii]